MTDTIADLVRRGRRTDLAGRSRELRLLDGLLADGGPVVAYLHGPPGIGKSALLTAFEAGLDEAGVARVRVEAGAVEPRPEAILAALGEPLGLRAPDLPGLCRAMAEVGDGLVLMIDDVDTWRLAATWLRLDLVPRLPARARLVLAGAAAPPPAWSAEFGSLFLDLRLGPLDRPEVEAMVLRAGLDPAMADRIWRLCGGHPLSVRLAIHAARSGAPTVERGAGDLAGAILQAIGDDELRRATEACAIVRRGSRELLSRILASDGPVSAELIDRMESLPFVGRDAEGIFVAESVRRAFAERLSGLEPERCAEWRRSAAGWITARLRASGPAGRWRHMADLLHLLDQPILRDAFFPPDEPAPPVESARPEDFPVLLALTGARRGADERLRTAAWAERLPHRFSVARNAPGEVAGFYLYARGDDPLAGIEAADPVLADWLAHLRADPAPGEVIFVRQMLAQSPAPDAPARIACNLDLKRSYIERWGLARVYCAVSADEMARPLLHNLGFRAATPARGGSPGTMILDLPGADLIGWVSSLVGAAEPHRPQAPAGLDFARDRREVRAGGGTITLTRLEAEVLSALIDRAPDVVGREDLIESVWRRAFVGSNVVDTVIRSLRRKLGPLAACIRTVPKAGYRYVAPDG